MTTNPLQSRILSKAQPLLSANQLNLNNDILPIYMRVIDETITRSSSCLDENVLRELKASWVDALLQRLHSPHHESQQAEGSEQRTDVLAPPSTPSGQRDALLGMLPAPRPSGTMATGAAGVAVGSITEALPTGSSATGSLAVPDLVGVQLPKSAQPNATLAALQTRLPGVSALTAPRKVPEEMRLSSVKCSLPWSKKPLTKEEASLEPAVKKRFTLNLARNKQSEETATSGEEAPVAGGSGLEPGTIAKAAAAESAGESSPAGDGAADESGWDDWEETVPDPQKDEEVVDEAARNPPAEQRKEIDFKTRTMMKWKGYDPDDESSLGDVSDLEDEEPNPSDLCIALFETVNRPHARRQSQRGKWRIHLKNGVLKVDGHELLFNSLIGEFDF